jgi:PEP-CTERM motif-containing protein
MKTPNSFTSILGALALLLFGGNAMATTETFDLTGSSISNLNGDFTVTGFNTSLGTLTGIALDFNVAASANVSVINLGSTSGNFTNASASFSYSLTGPGGSALLTAVPVSATVASGIANAGPGVITNFPANTVNSPVDLTLSSGFSSYETAGPEFTLSAPSGTYGGTTGDSNVLFSGNASATPTGTISYTYTVNAVPEPSSWAMGFLCMGVFAVLRFRARRTLSRC